MGDVKQMYTELDHSEIRKSVVWILDLFAKRFGPSVKVRRQLSKQLPAKRDNVMLGSSAVSSKRYMTMTLDQIASIVDFDLDFSIFQLGSQIYRQIKGIPMGSHLSPILAYLICEYYERRIPLRISAYHLSHIFGARYMDDILIIRTRLA